MKYKAIIFDLDGTAITNTPNSIPSQRLKETVNNSKDSILLCAATGRPITNAKPILSELNLDQPCVISAGTQIVNPINDEILWEATIDGEDVKRVLNICMPFHYEVLVRNELIGEGGAASSRNEIKGHVNVIYIMACAESDAKVMLTQLAKIPNVTAAGVTAWTQDGVDIHITHKNATKEHAVAELLRILKVDKSQSIGIGDADNDVHLFAGVGHKVAMGNATNKLKSLSDEITASVDEDGLAIIIEKYS